MARAVQGELAFRSWGGRRPGAGRPATAGRRPVPHRSRAPHDVRAPVHVTMRAAAGLPSLRGVRIFDPVRRALAVSSHASFRILHFSVQADHVHLLVEADHPDGLVRGCQGLAVRVAKAVNRTLGRRGAVWGDRYHARRLGTPREFRNALAYVLNNWLKHVPGARGRDPRSSAAWFNGWRTPGPQPLEPAPVSAPRTWLARKGWLRQGRLDPADGPARSGMLRPRPAASGGAGRREASGAAIPGNVARLQGSVGAVRRDGAEPYPSWNRPSARPVRTTARVSAGDNAVVSTACPSRFPR